MTIEEEGVDTADCGRLHRIDDQPPVHLVVAQEAAAIHKVVEGDYGLANVAATVVSMMGYDAPEVWEKPMIKVK